MLQASFETPWFAAGDACNMSFFYHMSDRIVGGNNMGSLLVEVKTVQKTWFAVFWKAGNQGNQWHQGNVDLSVRSRFFLSWTIIGVFMGRGDGGAGTLWGVGKEWIYNNGIPR